MSWSASRSDRVLRGGSWGNNTGFVQVTSRGCSDLVSRCCYFGLRFVRRST